MEIIDYDNLTSKQKHSLSHYKRIKEICGDALLATFEEYYNAGTNQPVLFKCSECDNIFMQRPFKYYHENKTRCKECQSKYLSKIRKEYCQSEDFINKKNSKPEYVKELRDDLNRSQKKALNTYNKLKEEFGDNLISTFEEYYYAENKRQIQMKCSICNKAFNQSPYNYRDGMTRCKDCRYEYKSQAIKNSKKFQKGVLDRDENRRNLRIEKLQDIWKDELILDPNDIIRTSQWGYKVKYKCKKCGHEGYQASYYLSLGLIEGTGCSNMCHRTYKGSSFEQELYEFITDLGFKEDVDFIRHDRSLIKNEDNHSLELDFYFPKYKLALEFNGDYYHSYNNHIKMGMPSRRAKYYHFNKTKQCEDLGIHLIHIWQHDWLTHKDRVKSIIKGDLGLTENRIFARKCIIKEVAQKEYRDFVTSLSMLGYRNARHRYGLYYNDELVMCMGVDYCQSGKGYDNKNKLEVVRSVTKLDTIVIGGTSKLLKHIIPIMNQLYPDIHELIYFIDYDKHLGKSVEKSGAIFDNYTGPSIINYCMRSVVLENKQGNKKRLYVNKAYSRMPAYHQAVKEAVERDDILALYTSGTKKFHYNI